jgi:hypothetical protein
MSRAKLRLYRRLPLTSQATAPYSIILLTGVGFCKEARSRVEMVPKLFSGTAMATRRSGGPGQAMSLANGSVGYGLSERLLATDPTSRKGTFSSNTEP